MNTVLKGLLVVSGLILVGIGGALLLAPEAMHAMNGVVLADNASLLSEIRAPGALLIGGGLIILVSAFVRTLMVSGLALSGLIYGTYAIGRLVSIGLDGLPADSLVTAAGLEVVLGVAGLIGAWGASQRGA